MIKTKRLRKFDRDWYYKPEKDAPIYWASRNTLTDDQVNDFLDWCLHWCYKKFGKVKGKALPELEWMWNDRGMQENKLLGEYDREDNLITLRVQSHRTIYNLANTVIHEYIHYLQPTHAGWYDRYHNHYGYENNPYEVEAFRLGDLYAVECARTVMEWMSPPMGGSRRGR